MQEKNIYMKRYEITGIDLKTSIEFIELRLNEKNKIVKRKTNLFSFALKIQLQILLLFSKIIIKKEKRTHRPKAIGVCNLRENEIPNNTHEIFNNWVII